VNDRLLVRTKDKSIDPVEYTARSLLDGVKLFNDERIKQMIMRHVLVLPPSRRTYTRTPTGQWRNHALTELYLNIVRANHGIARSKTDLPSRQQAAIRRLHAAVIKLIANTKEQSLQTNLAGKEGRIRGDLLGKRVNFNARTVITGDPMLRMNEIRLPECITSALSFPETIRPDNIEKYRRMLRGNHGYAYYQRGVRSSPYPVYR
jgi:DNA-directed RNA polymerase beta' subunit